MEVSLVSIQVNLQKGSRLSFDFLDEMKDGLHEPLKEFADYMSKKVQSRIEGGYTVKGRAMEHVTKNTIAKRKVEKRPLPLIDTGRMLRSFGKNRVGKYKNHYTITIGINVPKYASIQNTSLFPGRKPRQLKNPRTFLGMSKVDERHLMRLVGEHISKQ